MALFKLLTSDFLVSTPGSTPPSGAPSSGSSLTTYLFAAASLVGLYFIKTKFLSSPKYAVSQDILDQTQMMAVSNRVVVFSKSHCPYCTRTKKLLADLGVKHLTVVELNQRSDGRDLQAALYEITGQSTVPNIFIAGKHVGGNSHLQALNAQGKLMDMLKTADAF